MHSQQKIAELIHNREVAVTYHPTPIVWVKNAWEREVLADMVVERLGPETEIRIYGHLWDIKNDTEDHTAMRFVRKAAKREGNCVSD